MSSESVSVGTRMAAVLLENLKKAWHVRYPTGILCHRFRFIFFPVPKAATSSIKKLIARMDDLPGDGNPHHDVHFDVVWARDLDAWRDYRTFTVVRNPWDRLVSCFKDKIRGSLDDTRYGPRQRVHEGFDRYNKVLGRQIFRPDMTFDQFVRAVARIPDAVADEHVRSQYRMFSRPDGALLVERILKFESLADELPGLLRELGADDLSVDHEHKSVRSAYRDFYTDELAEITARRYRRDIRLLDYSF